MAKPSPTFPIADLKNDDFAELTIHYTQVNPVIGKRKIKNAEVERNLRKVVFDFVIDLKTLIEKISIDPKLQQVRKCAKNKQTDGPPTISLIGF